ncbi:hypothetical protein DFQ28_008351 [Apophysomyces sp. BC1034]|nr:hypothetical protein DFQ30_008070 [Apophysomyces sp. BC1015]KAG0182760.1 hypothetical protein DFQ29_002395 [Apophysomyces sp. BC1021]KAG0186083.1 hypothetical protein DFQ28_008351 [Apophysomyces sp. BC1034]
MDTSVSQQAYTSMMKFTLDGRPYVKDIHDLFAALIVQIRFDTHRYLFRNYANTFTSEDAIQALANLRFSHSVRNPDPNDPSKLLRTTTTTTFNMARDMAKALCQHFVWARLLESAVDQQNRSFRDRNIWQLTPKGLYVLKDFCIRTEIDWSPLQRHLSHINTIQLVQIYRTEDDDQILLGRQYASTVFRAMISGLPLEGETPATPPSRPASIASNDSSSSSSSSSAQASSAPFAMQAGEALTHPVGVTAPKRHKSGTIVRAVFSSLLCCDWITEFCSVASRDEAEILATEFLKQGWIEYQDSKQSVGYVRAAKAVNMVVTGKGKQLVREANQAPVRSATTEVVGHTQSQEDHDDEEDHVDEANVSLPRPSSTTAVDANEGNSQRLKSILDDAQLRSLFKDFLRANFCEENLDFWIDLSTLKRKRRNQSPAMPTQNQKELLEDAYDIWSTYLAPGAPSELNVEHSMLQEMARVVSSMVTIVPTYTPGQVKPTIVISTPSTSQSLRIMLKWFDKVEEHICRLMASDSVPKFVRTPKYRKIQAARDKADQKRDSGTAHQEDNEPRIFREEPEEAN